MVTYAYDSSGRVQTVINGASGSTQNYASSILYAPHGTPKLLTYGGTGGILEGVTFNSRLQPTSIGETHNSAAVLGLGYTYGTTDNNGNVRTHTVTSGATRKQIELALESDLRQYGPDHPTVAVRRVNLAAVLYSLRDYREALVEIDRALELHRRKLPAGHPHIWGAEEWRETILRAMGG